MESNQNDYHISFFRPTTVQAKWNRNLAIKLILIWAVAVFGFHFLLKAIEKPTPEAAYLNYKEVWGNVMMDNASTAELQSFAHSSLSVLGKVFVSSEEKAVLSNALSWTTFQLADSAQKELIFEQVVEFEKLKSEITSISDPDYIGAKNKISQLVSPILGLENNDPRKNIVSISLVSSDLKEFNAENKDAFPAIMTKYLIHNQSFLTDFKFLGFPFHYFYSAVFLLILFVFLCWIYCVRVDAMNLKLDIEE
ncbi:MAG: hypothetical protein C0597_12640 [Marinilabiliales bacterium]|nr:MAG: hypothetical protein C0597_12640 [Marinilabiliales bacterium]